MQLLERSSLYRSVAHVTRSPQRFAFAINERIALPFAIRLRKEYVKRRATLKGATVPFAIRPTHGQRPVLFKCSHVVPGKLSKCHASEV